MRNCLKGENECSKLRRFYRAYKRHKFRNIGITRINGLSESCGKVGAEVHYKIHFTPTNVDDSKISINLDKLIKLRTECHNKEHGRFASKTDFSFIRMVI